MDRVDPVERGRNVAPPSDSESEESENTGALEVENLDSRMGDARIT